MTRQMPRQRVVNPPQAEAAQNAQAGLAGMAGMAGVVGLTLSRALLFLPDRETVFAQLLRQFVDCYAGGAAALGQALDRGDAQAAIGWLHALRGACGAVGAVALQQQAQALERALVAVRGAPRGQRGARCQALQGDAAALHQTLQTLGAEIRARLPA